MFGIDVASYGETVNWSAVKNSGKMYGIVKSTEGVTIKDPSFSRYWQDMKQAGIIRGAYHYFHPLKSDPVQQAREFLKTVKLEPGDLPPVLDVETTNGASSATVVNAMKLWLLEVMKGIQQQTGKKIKPIIYTYPNFWINTLKNPSDFSTFPLWIAHYDVEKPWIPSSWGEGNWAIHQYKGDVRGITGVSGVGDLNKFNLLFPGAKGTRVREIQQQLKDFKQPEFDPGSISGDFDEKTKKAIIAFQTANKLQVDGIIGLKTWVQLLWYTPPVPKPPVTPTAIINLVDLPKSYTGGFTANQDQAIKWLQSKIPQATLAEFAQRWKKSQ